MKKLVILLSFILVLSFVIALEFIPEGNINLKDTYNITNVPYYNGTDINITGLYYGNGSQLTGVLTSANEGNLNVNSSNFWDNLNTTSDITGLIDSQISDTLTIGSGSSVDKGALANAGTLGFDWIDSEIADTLTIDVSSSVVWAALNTYPSTCTSSQYISVLGDTLTCAAISIAISQITDIANANVNSSDFWDNLNSPSDINAADITDDGTYLLATGDNATGNYNFSDTLFVDSTNDRVGIGTNSPTKPLDVDGSVEFGSTFIKPSDSAGLFIYNVQEDFGGNLGNLPFQVGELFIGNAFNDNPDAAGEGIIFSQSGSEIKFYTNGDERVKIDGSGNVGIGTTITSSELQVAGDIHLQNDSDKLFLGELKDVSIEMNGTSFNILDEVGSIPFYFQSFLKYVFDNDVEINGSLNILQTVDNVGIQINGFDDLSGTSGTIGVSEFGRFTISSDIVKISSVSGLLELSTTSYVEITSSDSFRFNEFNSVNAPIRLYGQITEAATRKYIDFLVDDTDNKLHLTKQDGNITGFVIEMPVNITSNVTIGGILQLEMNTTTVTCNEANAGSIYYNNDTNKHYGCNVTDWQALY